MAAWVTSDASDISQPKRNSSTNGFDAGSSSLPNSGRSPIARSRALVWAVEPDGIHGALTLEDIGR